MWGVVDTFNNQTVLGVYIMLPCFQGVHGYILCMRGWCKVRDHTQQITRKMGAEMQEMRDGNCAEGNANPSATGGVIGGSTPTTGFGCNSTMQSQDDNLMNKRIMC